MKKKIILGMIGAGKIGRVHGKSVMQRIPGATIKTIADPYLNNEMEEFAAEIGVLNVSKNVDDIFTDKEIEAVLICSSTDTHSDLIIRAAKAGKHIFCEKPVDFDLERIKKTLDIVKKSGVKFQIGFNRRFDHNFSRIKEVIDAGTIGEPQLLKIASRDPAPPSLAYVKVSGGLFLDMMIHDFDMARFLMDSEAESVFASGAVLIDEEIGKAGDVDTAIVNIKFKNGALGVIDNSRKAVYGYDQRVEVFGSKGCSQTENDAPSRVYTSTIDGVVQDKPHYFFLERYFDAYAEEVTRFIKYLNEGGNSPCGYQDAIMPVVMGLAAKKSIEENRPVLISEIL